MPDYYAVALLIVFYALVVAELFIPSGGLLGAIAVIVAITSVIIGFTVSVTFGVTLFLVYLLTTPILFVVALYVWPKTRLGRSMLNRDALETDTTGPPPTTLDGVPLEQLVGQLGQATSSLLPSGQVKVDGHKTTAVSTGLPIESGQWVKVVRLYGGKIQVREATPEEVEVATNAAAPRNQATVDSDSESPKVAPDSSRPISTTLDDIDLEELT
ncbi:NfeD family protein [Neorhodopirellula lusitana]|uniref:NfeD family protein n=1 Tax=Neorhodopirellula lusitana TaxID=445327 RepID=UPI00384BC130